MAASVVSMVNFIDTQELMNNPGDPRHVLPLAERIMRRIMRHNTVHEHTDLLSSVLQLGLCTIEEHKADDRSRCVRSFLATAAKAVNIDVWLQNQRPQDAARTARTVADAMSTSLRHLVHMFQHFREMGHGGYHCHRVVPSLTRTVARVVELLRADGGGDFACLLDEISAQHPRLGAPLVGCSNPFCTNVTRDTEDEMMIRIAKDRATRCSGCHADKYCSPECQRSHWDTHHREVCLMGRPSTSDAAAEGEASECGEREASEGGDGEASEGEACEASMCSGGSGTTFSDRSGGPAPTANWGFFRELRRTEGVERASAWLNAEEIPERRSIRVRRRSCRS